MSKIGERIRELRGKLSQKELAEKLGIRRNYISNYETRNINPTADVLIAFAQKLNININWLLTGEGSMYYDSGDITKDELITQLQSALNEKDKQLQRVREAAQTTKSETSSIRAAEKVVTLELLKKSKLKRK